MSKPNTKRGYPEPNPTPFCMCGCGQRTKIAPDTDRTKGRIAGQPLRFVRYHQPLRERIERECSIEGCGKKAHARGWCSTHYSRWWSYGDPNFKPPHWSEIPERRAEITAKASAKLKGRVVSNESRRRMSIAHKGVPLSPQHIANSVAARRGKPRKKQPASEKMLAHLERNRLLRGPTRPELALRALLDELGVEFLEQERIGVYTVDFYVPKTGLVLEADGVYWHGNEAKERARDEYLLRNPRVNDIVHLTDEQLMPWTPKERHSTEYRTAIRAA